MDTNHITQAVSIADALLMQYDQILARMDGVDGSGETAAASFSNLIGEANQVYGGIWEHLDMAAEALKQAGHEVHRYPQLRTEHGGLGILDSDSATQVALGASLVIGGLATKTTVAAKANTAGAAHAADASELFKSKLPQVDWAALRQEAEAPTEDLSPGVVRYFPYIAGAAIVTVIALLALS